METRGTRMAYLSFIWTLALTLSIIPLSLSDSAVPFQLTPSSESYGPDGPWQAVSVQIGENQQQIDLLPGGTTTILLGKKKCSHNSICGAGGIFDNTSSASFVWQDESTYPSTDWVLGLLNFSGTVDLGLDDLTLVSPADSVLSVDVANFSLAIYEDIDVTIGEGVPYPFTVGQLALSPPPANGSLSTDSRGNGTYIPDNLKSQGLIPSSSFGLHYGSAALQQNLSCWLGGYDQQRLVGPVSSQAPANSEVLFSANLQIDLFDIGIGVETGGSPFSFPSKQGLLASNNESIGNWLPVVMDPYTPFLALPNSTCNAIADTIPVNYNSTLGLYLWDTTSPSYAPIVTSPSFLSFTFRLSLSSSDNFTINVPFSLLNLTLEPPLVSKPSPYFPCQAPPVFDRSYSLGRAFLQAAFIGGNWDPAVDKWYLAQAPGPNIATQEIPVAMTDDGIVNSSTNAWADTWKGAWTPLPSNAASPDPSNETGTPSKNLSGGAIAGIVIGVLLALALLSAGALLLFLHRKRQQRRRATLINSSSSATPYQDQTPKMASPSDLFRPEFKYELGHDDLHEMGEQEHRLSELMDSSKGRGGGVGELDAAGTPTATRADKSVGGSPTLDSEGLEVSDSGESSRLDVDLGDRTGLMGGYGEGRNSRRVSAL